MELVGVTSRGVCVEVDCTDAGACRANDCVAPPRACPSSRECTDQVCHAMRGVCVDCSLMLTCGAAPDACDGAPDGRPNYIDLDSNNDGVSDADEHTRATNPCARDTDADGATDLVERIARTEPTAATSRLPTTSQVAALPNRPADVGPVDNQEFAFAQRLRPTDVMVLVNSTGSTVTSLTAIATAVSAIIDGVTAGLGGASADLRVGVADYRDFGEGAAGDNGPDAFNVRLWLDANASLTRSALTRFSAASGGDASESEVPSMFGLLNGFALATYGGAFNRPATNFYAGSPGASTRPPVHASPPTRTTSPRAARPSSSWAAPPRPSSR
jgi:hypothetical protein